MRGGTILDTKTGRILRVRAGERELLDWFLFGSWPQPSDPDWKVARPPVEDAEWEDVTHKRIEEKASE